MSDIAQLIDPIRAALIAQARDLGIDANSIAVEPILNWGGFINRSFRVSDGQHTLFLKLTSDPEIKRGLEIWRQLAALLNSRYHAPRVVGWLNLPRSAFSGLVFEWIEGNMVEGMDQALAGEISGMVRKLHGDTEMAALLPGPVSSCAQAYLDSYHDRFMEDLAFVASDPPPFVSPDRIDWLRSQISILQTRVQQSPAFREPADCPVHGDLWLNNVMVDHAGHWYVLDWDGLRLGDPVIDWTMLFGPSRAQPQAATEEVVLSHDALNGAERQRLTLYAQASQLDWVLDPLADWVQGSREAEHGARVRTANERIHHEALQAYAVRYGS